MKNISILVPNGTISIVNVAGTHQMLSWVNEFNYQQGREPLFSINLVGAGGENDIQASPFQITPEIFIEDNLNPDLIIIPAIHDELNASLSKNNGLTSWLIDKYRGGAEIASLCLSSFFLASTGLLDGKPCSTHWQFANDFRERFPKVILRDEKIITEADGIYTSGGAYAFTNLIIYLIEKYAGRDMAIMAAKGFMIDIDRSSQSPFMIFSGLKSHKDEEVLDAQNYIEQHYHEKIVVDQLSKRVALGRRTFERRFKKATSNSVVEYQQRVKVEAAKKQLERGRKTVNEVMYEVGYTDPKAFRNIFKRYTDMTPNEYLNKYNTQMIFAN